MNSATVVGSGPNGLAAAIVLAEAGLDVTVLEAAADIGGGTRSGEAILPGLIHDHCAAIHPMAVGSPFLRRLGLDRYGLAWAWPEIDCAHPLDDGSAAALHRSVDVTASGLVEDERTWRLLFERSVANYPDLRGSILGPLLRVPRHPLQLAMFGLPATLPATVLAGRFRTEPGRALFGGVAAHAFTPLDRPLSSSIGLGILTAGHADGWACAIGGSGAISRAMATRLDELGGTIETRVRIESAAELPDSTITMWDTSPTVVARALGDRLPRRIAAAYRKFRYGPGAFKVDFAVEGGVPWTAAACRRAGTVHLTGDFAEIAAGERDTWAGRMPERPFVLVGQQYLADPGRSVGDVHPVYSYAHVPNGYTGDATEAIIAQFERFAPGFRDRVVGMSVRTTPQFASDNENFTGGNILTGAKDIRQLIFGPRATLRPYDVGVPGHFICSAATPPGPGAHGMCGANAAARALRATGLE